MGRRFCPVNLCCFGAGLLIVATFFYPVWCLTAQAVQYETEFPEGLKVYVYLSQIRGEIYELNLMTKWIGAHFPENIPEMVIFPVLFGGLALLCAASIFFNDRKKTALKLAVIVFLFLVLTGIGSLQGRLYAFGHVRDANPPILVPDFTVPLLGSMKLWNWTITTGFDIGAYTMGLAALLVVLACRLTAGKSKNVGKMA